MTLISEILPLDVVSYESCDRYKETSLPEAEEVLDLAVASGRSDVLDVDSRVGRHFECVVL